MTKNRRLLAKLTGLLLSFSLVAQTGITAQANSKNYLDSVSGGVAAILNPSVTNTTEVINATAKELNLASSEEETEEQEQSKLVMANVRDALNVRTEPNEDAEKVGKLYKDCGGTILEREAGWTKLKSGNMIGWAKDEYLLFNDEAKALANDVGRMTASMNDALRVRQEPSTEVESYDILAKNEVAEVLEVREDGWICIDYEGNNGYVLAEYVTLDFQIDSGETMDEINAREQKEQEVKTETLRNVNYGEYTTDADTTLLLAALIQCEAGGESYEGQVAVGAVVMNRVRSSAYPDTIHGVIYASGQFTPAINGKVNRVYESGNIYQSCIEAAQEALSGTSNVGDLTHFRRNNGREGLVIGNHVFY